MIIELPKWYDLHAHFRQGDMISPMIDAHFSMGCAGILAMPNTSPPVAKITEKSEAKTFWSLEHYRGLLENAAEGRFQNIIVPLYLTAHTSVAMIEDGVESGYLKACKYYPPHGTTGAEFGAPFEQFFENGVFKAMEDNGIVLCIHGEQHALAGPDYFDKKHNAEELFYQNHMPRLAVEFPNLKIVCEHVTTKVAADFVSECGDNVGATITPQHLLYTVGDLLQGLKYHLFCLPLLKFETDRQALRDAAMNPSNKKFFAGTDSAPHSEKMTACGCAAGCFTGGIAPQLYAMAFEEAGIDFSDPKSVSIFKSFLCLNGANFYGLPIPDESFKLEKKPQEIKALEIAPGKSVKPLPLGLTDQDHVQIPWSIQL